MKKIDKKKGTRDSSSPTAVSSPIRGANQDQSGYGVSHSTADYTISDETQYDEGFVAGVGAVRATPIQMNSTPRGKRERNAPRSSAGLQRASDKRRMQLDRVAQKRTQMQKKTKEKLIAQRQRNEEVNLTNLAQKVGAESKPKMTKDKVTSSFKKFSDFFKEEVKYVEEGRPKKNAATSEDPGSDHIVMQLRKAISLRGQHPVKFVDGKSSLVSPATAHRLLTMHDNMKTSAEKDEFAKHIHKSVDHMRDALAGKMPEKPKNKISLGGSHGNNRK
jgi:hypothetical protein